ncbi:CCC motif membrane protein [Spongiimicrobium salis]|uniref:CCC motif membrane protein n=1 Tax=Spongiimicrobium salis TaxID=1667022 RepID=UPI00374CCC13
MIIIMGVLGYLCCCLAGLGIIPSAIGFFLARKSEKMYAANPELYDNASQIKTGKIVALIAVILNVLMIVRIIYLLSTIGWSEMSEEFMRAYEEAMEAQGQ